MLKNTEKYLSKLAGIKCSSSCLVRLVETMGVADEFPALYGGGRSSYPVRPVVRRVG